jgi:hypothetical protein
VECILLAYLTRLDLPREDRHDLRRLAERSQFVRSFRNPETQDELTAHLADVYKRWRNDHRYRSRHSLDRFLNRSELYKTPDGRFVKGDVIVFQGKVLLEAVTTIVTWGLERWKSSNKK